MNRISSPVQVDIVTALDMKDLESFGDLTSGMSNVQAEFQLATNPRFQGFFSAALEKNPELKAKKVMDKTPVYILTFTGAFV